jgi:hypothetical protein
MLIVGIAVALAGIGSEIKCDEFAANVITGIQPPTILLEVPNRVLYFALLCRFLYITIIELIRVYF